MKWTNWCNVVLGIWLIISPWVLGFVAGSAAGNSVILGVAVIIVALIASGSAAARPARWVTALFGLWLIVSPWILGLSGAAATNDVIIGVLVAVFALIGIATTPRVAVS